MKKIILSLFILFFMVISVNAQEITINGHIYTEDEFVGENFSYTNNTLTLNNYEGGEILATEDLSVEIIGNVRILTSARKEAISAPTINIYGDGELYIETDTGFFNGNNITISNITINGISSGYVISANNNASINNVDMNINCYYLVIGGNKIEFLSSKLVIQGINVFQHNASGYILFDKCELDITSLEKVINSYGKVKFKDTYAKLTAVVYVTDKENIELLDDSKIMYSNGEKELIEGDDYINYLVIYIYPPECGGGDNPDNPPTGDNIMYWFIMLTISLSLIIISLLVLKKYYGRNKVNNIK